MKSRVCYSHCIWKVEHNFGFNYLKFLFQRVIWFWKLNFLVEKKAITKLNIIERFLFFDRKTVTVVIEHKTSRSFQKECDKFRCEKLVNIFQLSQICSHKYQENYLESHYNIQSLILIATINNP